MQRLAVMFLAILVLVALWTQDNLDNLLRRSVGNSLSCCIDKRIGRGGGNLVIPATCFASGSEGRYYEEKEDNPEEKAEEVEKEREWRGR